MLATSCQPGWQRVCCTKPRSMRTSSSSNLLRTPLLKGVEEGSHVRPTFSFLLGTANLICDSCQGISCGGQQGGLNDARSSLLVNCFKVFDALPKQNQSDPHCSVLCSRRCSVHQAALKV